MKNGSTQQLSPQGNTGKDEHGNLLAAASGFARSVLESIQALAGTTSCKGVQIARLSAIRFLFVVGAAYIYSGSNNKRESPTNYMETCINRNKLNIGRGWSILSYWRSGFLDEFFGGQLCHSSFPYFNLLRISSLNWLTTCWRSFSVG